MAAVEYGIIGIRPRGEWDPETKYDLLNLVTQNGSSYVAHTDPPLGTLPTNTAYWQTSAQGTSKATADSVGTVKPDGTTTEVSSDGSLSVKTAAQNTLGLVKGSNGIKVGTDGSIDVNTLFEQATELANIMAGEAFADVLGKISKLFSTTMNLDQNALLKNMLTNMDANDQNKVPTSAFVHTLWARIGMGEDLDIGANLTAVVKALNSNLTNLTNDLTVQKNAFNVSNATSQANYLTSYGKMRILDLSFRPSILLQATQSYVLYTLSSGNRPSYIVDTFALNSLGHKHRIQINTNGEVKIYPFDDIAINELLLINMSFAV